MATSKPPFSPNLVPQSFPLKDGDLEVLKAVLQRDRKGLEESEKKNKAWNKRASDENECLDRLITTHDFLVVKVGLKTRDLESQVRLTFWLCQLILTCLSLQRHQIDELHRTVTDLRKNLQASEAASEGIEHPRNQSDQTEDTLPEEESISAGDLKVLIDEAIRVSDPTPNAVDRWVTSRSPVPASMG